MEASSAITFIGYTSCNMASTVLKCALLALLMVSLVVAQRGRPLYPEGHPPSQRREEFRPSGKAGHCPPPLGRRPTSRGGRSCRRDEDCPDLNKCCNAGRGNTCVPPVFA